MEMETIGAFEKFLQWGPIGLAGLMLVLVVVTMVTSELTPIKAIILTIFMIVGAGCFFAALYFEDSDEHRLIVQVLPNDIDGSEFPPPRILANGQVLNRDEEFLVTEPTALSVDVSRAVGVYRETSQRAILAAATADEANSAVAELTAKIGEREMDLAKANRVIEEQQASLVEALDAGNQLAIEFASFKAHAEEGGLTATLEDEFFGLEGTIMELNENISDVTR